MDDYLKLLVLSYFKQNGAEYSFRAMTRQLGCTYERLEETIEALIDADTLKYKNNLLSLTPKGRLLLLNKEMDFYDFSEKTIESIKINSAKAWPLNKVYIPRKFTSKL